MQLSQDNSIGNPSQDESRASLSAGGHHGGQGSLSLLEALVIVTQNERLSPDVLRYPQDLIDSALVALAKQQHIIAMAFERHQERLRRKLAGTSADEEDDVDDFSLPGAGSHDLAHIVGSSLQLPIQPYCIQRLEATRMEFLVSELLRVRLQKIQQLCHRIHFHADQYRLLLSPKELIMAEKFCSLYEIAIASSAFNSVTNSNAAAQGITPYVAARNFFIPSAGASSGPGLPTPSLDGAIDPANPLPVPDTRARVFVCALEDMGQVEVGASIATNVGEGETLLAPLVVFEGAINNRRARLL